MTDIKIRGVKDWVVDAHKTLAARKGVSLESYMRDLLENVALQPQRELSDKLMARFERAKADNALLPAGFTTQLIREERDNRG